MNADIAALAERLAHRLLTTEQAIIAHMNAHRHDPRPADETLWSATLGYPIRRDDDQ